MCQFTSELHSDKTSIMASDNLLIESKIEENVSLNETTGGSQAENSDLIYDNTVPPGWGYKGEGGLAVFYAPDGSKFKSRRHAFESMMISGGKYSVQDILTMRSYLHHEGWIEEERLPDGWLIRRKAWKSKNGQSGHIFLMEQGGKTFKSITKAVQFVEKYSKYYTEEARLKLNSMLPKHQQQTPANLVSSNQNFIPQQSGPHLPQLQPAQSSPTHLQQSHSSRPQESANQEETDIVEIFPIVESAQPTLTQEPVMPQLEPISGPDQTSPGQQGGWKKADLSSGKWMEDDRFPAGWKYTTYTQAHKSWYKFMVPSGAKLIGMRSAISFMIKNNYSKEEIRKMTKAMGVEGWSSSDNLPNGWNYKMARHRMMLCHPEGNIFNTKDQALTWMKESGASQEDQDKVSKFVHVVKKAPVVQQPPVVETDTTSEQLQSSTKLVPDGWSVKIIKTGNVETHRIQSPDGLQYPGRRFALKAMIEKNCSEREIEEMRGFLVHEGWLTSEMLGEGWRYKIIDTMFLFMNLQTEVFYGCEQVLKHLRKDAVNNAKIIEQFLKFSKQKFSIVLPNNS